MKAGEVVERNNQKSLEILRNILVWLIFSQISVLRYLVTLLAGLKDS